jgi:outer membrane protein OmpA-like peptidoglycan-associated protein
MILEGEVAMSVQRSVWLLLGLGGVMLVPGRASAQENQDARDESHQGAGQSAIQRENAPIVKTAPGKLSASSGSGDTTTATIRPGEATLTKTDAAGNTTTRTMKTPPGAGTRITASTVCPSPIVPKSVPVFFTTDSDAVEPVAVPLLDAAASALRSNPSISAVQVEGHADTRGDSDYNLDLAQRRAQSVAQALEERGVSPKRVETHAYGAEKPVCARHDEDCWSQNRRVDIVPQMPGQQSQQTQQK